MNPTFYKLRRGRIVFGVFAGLADRFGLDANLLRFLFVLFSIFHFYGFVGLAIYCLCAFSLPYKEDIEREKYGLGPRKRKDAQVIKDDDPFF